MLLEQINQVNDIKKLNKGTPGAGDPGFSDRENQCDRRPSGLQSGRGGADHGHASGF